MHSTLNIIAVVAGTFLAFLSSPTNAQVYQQYPQQFRNPAQVARSYQCYVASSADANFPQNYGMAGNCTACVRGKYINKSGNRGAIYIWGCMTGSPGMEVFSNVGAGYPGQPRIPGQPGVQYPGQPGIPGGWGQRNFRQASGWSTFNAPTWSQWGPGQLPPAQPYNARSGVMCVDGSFEGYSNTLDAYAYMCVCCNDNCNQNLECKTFSVASSLQSSTPLQAAVTLLALTFASFSVLNA